MTLVDARFRDTDYRRTQNYVGEFVDWERERIHFVGPPPESLPDLMAGLIESHDRMGSEGVPAFVHAAVIAWGFVFLHPFEDGNGRIHRFLIHNILARRGFTPEGMMFPVSAVMSRRAAEYDESLEDFSRPLMEIARYSLDAAGRMSVHDDLTPWFRSIDLTAQAEALCRFIDSTLDVKLARELAFLVGYDSARGALREIVDMPDRMIDLFIRFCLQNDGILSARKRAEHFAPLSDCEVARMEEVVQSSFPALPG